MGKLSSSSQPALVRVARQAMATRFEIALHGDDPVRLRAAGEEALEEIERLEAQLSPYLEISEVARLNQFAACRDVRVSPDLFRFLERAFQLTRISLGTFDLTVGPLMSAWGFVGGTGSVPEPAVLASAREQVGMQWVELDPTHSTVRFLRPGVRLDFGAFGKGLGIDLAVERLREAGVESALIHGGTSSIYAIGRQPGGVPWRVGLEGPTSSGSQTFELLKVVELENESLSVSAVWGRSFQTGSGSYGHVIDPRTGQPVNHTLLSAVVLPSAAESDALSTALLVLGGTGLQTLSLSRPGLKAVVMSRSDEGRPPIRVWGWD